MLFDGEIGCAEAKLGEFQQTEEYKKYRSAMKRIQKPKPKAKASNAGKVFARLKEDF